MANHRLQVVSRRPEILATLASVARMDWRSWAILAFRFVFFVVGLSAVLYVSVGWVPAAVWFVLSLVDLLVDALLLSASDRDAKRIAVEERRMMDRLASQPGGAPLIADVGGHCGCVHRYAWDEVKNEWLQVTVVELNRNCPLAKEHAHH